MHAIGYRCDRHLFERQFGPEMLEHFLRYGAMQHAHRVAERRSFQRQDGHGEALRHVLHVGAAERQQRFKRKPGFVAVIVEMLVNQAAIE